MLSVIYYLGSILMGLIIGISLSVVGSILYSKKIRKRAVEKKLGCYDTYNGNFVWLNKDLEYIYNGISNPEILDQSYQNQEATKVFKIFQTDNIEI